MPTPFISTEAYIVSLIVIVLISLLSLIEESRLAVIPVPVTIERK